MRSKLPAKHGGVQRDEQGAREGSNRGAERERHQLEPGNGHPHQLGGKRVLTHGAPGAAGPRTVDEAQGDEEDGEDAKRNVEVRNVEHAVLAHGDHMAEEAQRVDLEDAVDPSCQVCAEDAVTVEQDADEDLVGEQRHDREVVATESFGRQADDDAEQRSPDQGDRDHEEGRPMKVELWGAQDRVGVGTEAVEDEIAEIEKPAPADHDVQTEGEHHEEDRVEGDPPPVPIGYADRHQGEERDEQCQPRPPGHASQTILELPERPPAPDAMLAMTRHPFVATHLRATRALSRRRLPSAFERPSQFVVEMVAAHLRPSSHPVCRADPAAERA